MGISSVNVTKFAGNCGFGLVPLLKNSLMENLIFCGVINPEFLFLIQDVEVIVNTPKKSAVFETLQKIFWR